MNLLDLEEQRQALRKPYKALEHRKTKFNQNVYHRQRWIYADSESLGITAFNFTHEIILLLPFRTRHYIHVRGVCLPTSMTTET
jgi:hypothetical protein